MSDEQCNLRLQMMEMKIEQHDAEITAQGESLGKMTNLLNQIRWMATGATGTFLASELGLFELLQRFLGV